MTDNSEQTPAPATNPDDNNAETRGDTSRRNQVLILVLLALLVLAAVAASGYGIYMNRQLQSQLQAQQQTATTSQERLGKSVDELATGQEQLQQTIDQLETAQQTTSDRLQELTNRERMDNTDWALAEIEHLLIIASQRINLRQDADSALAALEAAARRLKDLNNPSLIPVREQLTSDINALKAVPETDVPGMALYLNDLISRAETLPLAADTELATETATSGGSSGNTGNEVSGWRGLVSEVWNEVRQLVVIQREDAPPEALLAPDQRYFLYQNLRVELASAREAVLRRDTRNLQASLELIRDWLERYFDTASAAAGNVLESLEQMQTVELQPELPDISGSLESVRAWQRQQAAKQQGDS